MHVPYGSYGASTKHFNWKRGTPSQDVTCIIEIIFSFHIRVFSRIAMIPFNKGSGIQTLQGSLSLKAALQPLIKKSCIIWVLMFYLNCEKNSSACQRIISSKEFVQSWSCQSWTCGPRWITHCCYFLLEW